MPGATTSVATQCSTNYILFSKKLVAPGVASLKNIILGEIANHKPGEKSDKVVPLRPVTKETVKEDKK